MAREIINRREKKAKRERNLKQQTWKERKLMPGTTCLEISRKKSYRDRIAVY